MNTPKLISPLSSPLAALDITRSKLSSPEQALDFSRLLGEKRSELPATPVSRNPGQREASAPRNTEKNVSNTESTSREAAPSTASSSGAGNSQSAQESSASNTTPSSSNEAKADNASQAPGETSSAQAPEGEHAANDAEANSSAAADTPAEQASAVAEAGLPAIASATPNSVITTPVAAAAAALPQEHAAQVVATSAPAFEEDAANTTVLRPGLLPQAEALRAQAALLPTNPTTPASAQANAALPAPATAADALKSAVADFASGPAQASRPSPTSTASANPWTPASDTSAAALASGSGAANSAAALSLQLYEFSAMVAAARETAGTSLSQQVAVTPFSPQPVTGVAVPGLMPTGLLATQAVAGLGATGGITAPLNSPQWPTELGRQFINIAHAGKGLGQVAELRLDPPELGPLRITISLNDNVAHAVFSSPHALVRQTVEGALPQLQQMLEQSGISLGQADVNDQHQAGSDSQQNSAQKNIQGHANGTSAAADSGDAPAARANRALNPDALVDTFA